MKCWPLLLLTALPAYANLTNNATLWTGTNSAPYIALGGDSIMEGYLLSGGWFTTVDPPPGPNAVHGIAGQDPAHILTANASWLTATNYAVQGFSMSGVYAYQLPYVTALKPKYFLVADGINDISGGGLAQIPTTMAWLNAIYTNCQAVGVKLIIGEVLPCNNGGNYQLYPALNGAYRAFAATNYGVYFMASHDSFGIPPGYTNLIAAYSDDGLHHSAQGQTNYAYCIISKLCEIENGTNVIPDARRFVWSTNTVGVPGDIPNVTTIYTNMASGDSAAHINTALANCPSNQLVYLPAGTYTINTTLKNDGGNGWVLRGAGPGLTFLNDSSAGTVVHIGVSGSWSAGTVITNGYYQGSSNIMVASTAGFVPGALCMLDQLDDTNLVWNVTASGRRICQVATVISTNVNTITIWPPCYYPPVLNDSIGQLALAPKIYHASGQQNTMCGLENLTIDLKGSGDYGVLMEQAYACWVKNVGITNGDGYNMLVVNSARDTFRQLDMRVSPTHGPNHAGITLSGRVSGCLLEDSIFYQIANSMSIGDGGAAGCSGNVFAYNFATDSYQTSFGQYNELWPNHAPHNMFNLMEGNYANGVTSDGYFGSSSHNTVARNVLTGWTPTYPTNNSIAVLLNRWSLHWNVVGNILGTNGVATEYQGTSSGDSNPMIWRLGYPNSGNSSFTGTRPPNAQTNPGDDQSYDKAVEWTLLRDGNYDTKSGTRIYDTNSIAVDHVIPQSFYLSTAPSWWGTMTWPPYNPTNTSAAQIDATNIPAGLRFAGMTSGGTTATASATLGTGTITLGNGKLIFGQ